MDTTSDTTSESLRYAMVDSPVGPLWLIAEGPVIVGCWFDQPDRLPDLSGVARVAAGSDPVLSRAADILDRFFSGDASALNSARDLPLELRGTEMQVAVWQELRRIPVGQTRSYGGIARAIGRPRSFRPVGQAVGRNPISILVPCHRVVGSDGSLTGFGGGLERKIELLTREGVIL